MRLSTAALVDADDERWVLRGDALPERVDALATQLAHQGVRPGDTVALLLDHGPAAVLAFLAVLRCNACAIPVNPQLHAHEMGALLATRRPVLILVGEEPNPVGCELSGQIGAPLETLTSGVKTTPWLILPYI